MKQPETNPDAHAEEAGPSEGFGDLVIALLVVFGTVIFTVPMFRHFYYVMLPGLAPPVPARWFLNIPVAAYIGAMVLAVGALLARRVVTGTPTPSHSVNRVLRAVGLIAIVFYLGAQFAPVVDVIRARKRGQSFLYFYYPPRDVFPDWARRAVGDF